MGDISEKVGELQTTINQRDSEHSEPKAKLRRTLKSRTQASRGLKRELRSEARKGELGYKLGRSFSGTAENLALGSQ